MISERECYVYIALPGETEQVTVGKLLIAETAMGENVGRFVYAKSYLSRANAVAIDHKCCGKQNSQSRGQKHPAS